MVRGCRLPGEVDQLRGTASKLQAIADGLDSTHTRARYNTSMAAGTLGTGFAGADDLHTSHPAMKTWIAEMIKKLQMTASVARSPTLRRTMLCSSQLPATTG
jgi:hypothetical protein